MDLKFKDNSKLSLGYVQLEYIESTGTQYIPLRAHSVDDFVFDIECEITQFSTHKQIIGGKQSDNVWFGVLDITNNRFGLYKNKSFAIVINSTTVPLNTKSYIKAKLKNGDNYLEINGTKGTSSDTGTVPVCNISILGEGGLGCKLYSIKIYETDNLLYNLVPAIDSNDIACLYDTVSGTFFYNQGTGNFIAGPAVNPVLPETLLLKTTTFYHKNTPNVDGLQLLNGILSTQKTSGNVVLERIRVDIGNVSGSITKLLQYADIAGFNDAGEEQTKPRLVGTWTITGYITQEQLEYLQSAFDGLTIIASNIISAENCIVQSFDKNAPNYNPAIAIYHKSLCVTVNNIDGTRGLALLPAAIGSSYSFGNLRDNESGVDSVTDSTGLCVESYVNGEVKETTYYVEDFSYLKKLTQVTSLTFGVSLCNHIKNHVVDFPPNMASFNGVGIWTFNRNGDRIYYRFPKTVNDVYANFYTATTSALIFTGNVPTTRRDYGSFMSPQTFVGSGVDYYKDMRMYETYLATNKFNCNLWYTYTVPSISYSDGLCSVSVTRIKDLVRLSYKKSTDESWTEIENNGTFEWDGSGYVDAKAEYSNNDVYYSMRFYSETVESPTISYNTTTKQITLSSNIPNTTIYYTLDETYPTLDSTTYSDPIDATELGDIVKVRCFAVKDGMNDSEVIGKMCVVDDSLWGTDGDDSYFAVQCMDSTKPNYNPAVCIILGNNNKLTDRVYGGGCGYLTKTDAAAITNFGTARPYWFSNKVNVLDEKKLIDGTSFEFTSFNELKYFTSKTVLLDGYNAFNVGEFGGCTKLQSISLKNITDVKSYAFYNCPSLTNIVCEPNQITNIGNGAFGKCTLLSSINVQDTLITTTNGGVFSGCTSLTTIVYPSTLTTISADAFYGGPSVFFDFSRCTITSISNDAFFDNFGSIRFSQQTVPTISNPSSTWYRERISKIYIGDGISQSDDEAMLAIFANDAGFAPVVSKLDTWHNYLHPSA